MEDERGKKILSNLQAAFSKDKEIDEYDFIPVLAPCQNKNPILLVNHKLGIELWAVKVVFSYAYGTVLEWRTKHNSKRLCPDDIIQLTRAALLVNADCALLWNIRKEFIQRGNLDAHEDLCLGSLLLTKHPKSPETFAHRKWVLSRLKQIHDAATPHVPSQTISHISGNHSGCSSPRLEENPDLPPDVSLHQKVKSLPPAVLKLIQQEMVVCQAAAEKYPNNYNAWSHRIWVLQNMTQCNQQVLFDELNSTQDWGSRHVSDYSGFQYRQFLLQQVRLHLSLGPWCDLLQEEVTLVADLIRSFPDHEALWTHRRFAVYSLGSAPTVCLTAMGEPSQGQGSKRSKLTLDVDSILEREQVFCSKIMENNGNQWQEILAKRYLDWLARTFSGKVGSTEKGPEGKANRGDMLCAIHAEEKS